MTDSESNDGHVVLLFLLSTLLFGTLARYFSTQTSLSSRFPFPYTVSLFLIGLSLGIIQLYAKQTKGGNEERNADGSQSQADNDPSSEYEYLISMQFFSSLHPHLLLYIFLPALIFDSAFNIHFPSLYHVLPSSLLLAIPSLLLASLFTAFLVYFCFDYSFSFATSMMFGSMLSATDPVAVVAMLREVGAPKRLATLIEGESLLNDGTAFVLYLACKDWIVKGQHSALSGSPSSASISSSLPFPSLANSSSSTSSPLTLFSFHSELRSFLRVSLGGPLFGYVFGVVIAFWLQRIYNDAELEITITILSAYSCFWIAESELEVSGVLAVCIFGMYMSKRKNVISPRVVTSLTDVWLIIGYIANTIIFILSGIIVAEKLFHSSHIRFIDFVYLLLLYLGINLIRGVVILLTLPFIRHPSIGHYNLETREAVVLSWAGLRGALSLVLALLTSMEEQIDEVVRSRIMFLTSGIVLLTLIVNGTSCRGLVEWLQLNIGSEEARRVLERAMEHMRKEKEREMDEMKKNKKMGKSKLETD